jgi:hypothetical protein
MVEKLKGDMTVQRTLIAPQLVNAPHAWRIADKAARLALTVADADIYKYALQISDNTEWILVSVDPAVWEQRSIPPDGIGDIVAPLVNPEISITGAANLTSSTMHVCSGASADYTVTLPPVSGNSGKSIGVRMASGLTRWVTVQGNGSEKIDGVNTRKMWANEVAILMCDGFSWTKVAGKSIPVSVVMKRSEGVPQSIPSATFTAISTPVRVQDNTAALAVPASDTVNGRFMVPRDGLYNASGFASLVAVDVGIDAGGGVSLNSATPNSQPSSWTMFPAGPSGYIYASGSGVFAATAGQYITTFCYHRSGSGLSRNTESHAVSSPSLSVTEIVGW